MIYLLFTLFQEDDNDEHTGLSDLLVSKFSDDSKISDNIFSRIYFFKKSNFCGFLHYMFSHSQSGFINNQRPHAKIQLIWKKKKKTPKTALSIRLIQALIICTI